MKTCTKCGIEKDESEFNKCNKNKDGLNYWCKRCNYIRHKLWVFDNRERKNEYQRVKGKNKDYNKKKLAKAREYLLNSYIKTLIVHQFNIQTTEITPELINLKRIQLENKRLIKKLKENETK